MSFTHQPEVWQRGPVEGIQPLLQPVAHALLQAREEVKAIMFGFPDELLWQQPSGLASPAFHLEHMAGVLNRLFTYARGEALTPNQLDYLAREGKAYLNEALSQKLVKAFSQRIDEALHQLSNTDEIILTDARTLGRAKVPTTVIGLLFHSAEHIMRHTGQLLVTVQVLKDHPRQD
jgi:uncharacterized damage-inducible protein DinB